MLGGSQFPEQISWNQSFSRLIHVVRRRRGVSFDEGEVERQLVEIGMGQKRVPKKPYWLKEKLTKTCSVPGGFLFDP